MGTRNLTEVIYKNKSVIAQYGQWDGYLSGQGETISKFLRDNFKVGNLKYNLDRGVISYFKTDKEVDLYIDKVKKYFGESFETTLRLPELSRDTGAKILEVLSNPYLPKIKLVNSKSFSKDHLFCEYHYKINLSKETVTVIASGEKIGVYTFNEFKREGFTKALDEHINKETELNE